MRNKGRLYSSKEDVMSAFSHICHSTITRCLSIYHITSLHCTIHRLSVFMDSQNSGDWTECVTVENTQLPEGWLTKAHIGFTATTGQLADNHDILSFQAFSDFTVMEASEEADAAKKLFPTQESTSATERLKR